jgi:hypothetical protein
LKPCSLFRVNRCSGGIFRLHFLGWSVSQARNQHEAGSVLAWFNAQSWRWRWCRSPERPLTFNVLHCIKSPKTENSSESPLWEFQILHSTLISCCRNIFTGD